MEQDPPQPMSPFFRLHSDVIYFRRDQDSSTTITDEQNQFVVLSKLIETNCSKRSYWLYWLLGAIALVLLVLIIAVAIWMQMAKKRKLRKMVIIPEPRTYKETQIVYQIENAGLLKTDL